MTRRDLPPGCQAVQCCHALRQFVAEHASIDREWFEGSNVLVLLAVENEPALRELAHRARDKNLRWAGFWEPDLHGELTAIAIEPGAPARRLCRGLALAMNGE